MYQYQSTNNKKEGYGVLHSFPFVNNGPSLKTHGKQLQHKLQQNKRRRVDLRRDEEKSAPLEIQQVIPTWKPVTLDEKPPISYATLIAHAILSSQERKLTLNEIYQWISDQYPCYSIKDHRWQNSIRHNLSLQKAFIKLDRDSDTPTGAKGCYWTILPGYEQPFIDNLMKHDIIPTTATSTKKQKQSSSHLFTIFKMNTTAEEKVEPTNNKKKKLDIDDSSSSTQIPMWQENNQQLLIEPLNIDPRLYYYNYLLDDSQQPYYYDPTPTIIPFYDNDNTTYFNTTTSTNDNTVPPTTPIPSTLNDQHLFYM